MNPNERNNYYGRCAFDAVSGGKDEFDVIHTEQLLRLLNVVLTTKEIEVVMKVLDVNRCVKSDRMACRTDEET